MKRIITMAGIFAFLSGIFASAFGSEQYEMAEAYAGLREMVFTTTPLSIGLKPAADEVWGVVMETGYPKAVASLVALADGTVSLYFSNGGGIIGALLLVRVYWGLLKNRERRNSISPHTA